MWQLACSTLAEESLEGEVRAGLYLGSIERLRLLTGVDTSLRLEGVASLSLRKSNHRTGYK